MTKLFFYSLFISFLFVSCSENKYEKAIANYEQTINNRKLDLSFKLIDAKEIGTITVADSVKIYKETGDSLVNIAKEKLEGAREGSNIAKKIREDSGITNESLINTILESEKKFMTELENDSIQAEAFNQQWQKTYGNRDQNETLLSIVQCKYTIKDPLLNNIKVEIENKYLFSPDASILYGRYK